MQFDNLTDKFTTYLPTFLWSAVILLAGFLLGKIIQRVVKRLILILDRGLNERLQTSSVKIDLKSTAAFISSAFFWIIMIFSILLCIEILELQFLRNLIDRMITYLPNIIVAIIILFTGIICGRLLSDFIKSSLLRSGSTANRTFLVNGVRYFVIFVASMIAADQLGVHVGFLTDLIDILFAGLLLGAALAFGLGAKTSVSNILSAYYIKKDHQIGTRIRVGEVTGTIVKISDHAINLETTEGIQIIPAKEFNESHVIIIKEENE